MPAAAVVLVCVQAILKMPGMDRVPESTHRLGHLAHFSAVNNTTLMAGQ